MSERDATRNAKGDSKAQFGYFEKLENSRDKIKKSGKWQGSEKRTFIILVLL